MGDTASTEANPTIPSYLVSDVRELLACPDLEALRYCFNVGNQFCLGTRQPNIYQAIVERMTPNFLRGRNGYDLKRPFAPRSAGSFPRLVSSLSLS